MRIEKVNENQIRCTLTHQDLANRHLKLSELAYGTEKAKMLFHDMMQQANYEFGFEAEDIPLMIEAIPVSSETIILIITKVEYPEELDTRFSKFSDIPENCDDYTENNSGDTFSEGADDILDLFRKISEEKKSDSDNSSTQKDNKNNTADSQNLSNDNVNIPIDLTKMFIFDNLADIVRLAHILKDFYEGDNSIFKDENKHKYYLILHKSSLSPEIFNKVCNILAEYANQGAVTAATEAYLIEHHKILCHHHALQSFALL
ncbi:MAG: adaptor protein MecA [Eubacterium sp.]|jgi:adapter protein MecA 1/2|nr:adaptor protein MecA [Eubacterium sp.]